MLINKISTKKYNINIFTLYLIIPFLKIK